MSKVLAKNRQAGFNYEIEHRIEAGMVLSGQEVKSAKAGNISLKGAYVTVRDGEVFLVNAHISPYQMAGPLPDYNPTQDRKLLLKRDEIKNLIGKYKEQGMGLFPLEMRTKKGLVKLIVGIGRGKKKYDKRASIKKRDTDRKIKRALRGRR